MTVDELVMQGAKASAAMALPWFGQHITAQVLKGLPKMNVATSK